MISDGPLCASASWRTFRAWASFAPRAIRPNYDDRSAHASLSPTRLVKTSRFWLTDVLVAHGDKAEVLLAGALTSGSEEGDGATIRGLGSLSTRAGVHFGIEDADVHVFTGCPMMTVCARLL